MTQLQIDLLESDDAMVQSMARRAVQAGEFSDYHHAYETLWDCFESELKNQVEEVSQ